MKTKPKAGPAQDAAFFEDVRAAFAKHPEVAERYSVRYLGYEIDHLNIDFDRQLAEFSPRG
ncbi:hypothetical protein ACFWDI_26780 [Streptomyces sp. NPDC060064]|uniref:hypothetical protein n=1 Tax=Streptomyces sp. NPDC060064 TaxID=3347049 RepID=UPI0036B18F9D